MARKRFNADEKALIASLKPGDIVAWQNVTQWHTARVDNPEIIRDNGWEHIVGFNLNATKTLGRYNIWITPGHIRRSLCTTKSMFSWSS